MIIPTEVWLAIDEIADRIIHENMAANETEGIYHQLIAESLEIKKEFLDFKKRARL